MLKGETVHFQSIENHLFQTSVLFNSYDNLKLQSCKLYNKKYKIASTKVTSPEIFGFIAVLVLKVLSHKVLFMNRKDNRNC